MAATSTLEIIIRAIDKASKDFDKITSSAQKMGQQMDKVGRSMTKNLTLPIVGVGIAAVKAASDMDTALRNIQSVGKQTEEQVQALSKSFRDMSISGQFGTETAAGLAEAFFDIQGSGFAGADAMKVLEASAIGATAGATNTTVAMEGITAVLNSYGKGADEASHVSDLLFRTVDRGVGSYAELSGAMSNVVGTAAAVGVDFEEVAAALATMSKQGLSFSEASVSMNQSMLAFLKPSKEMNKVLSELGFESGLAAVEQLGFAGAMEAVAGAVDNDAAAMSELFGSVRGLRGALALTGEGAKIFAEDLAAMGSAGGSAQAAMETQMKSFDNQLKLFKNNFTAILIEIGNIILPVLNKIMEAITPIIQAFSGLDERTKTWIVTIAALVAVIGPVLIITAQMISAFMAVKQAIMAIRAAMVAFNLVAMMNPWVLVIMGVAAVVLLLAANWDKLKEAFQRVWDVAKGFFEFITTGNITQAFLSALGITEDGAVMRALLFFRDRLIEFVNNIKLAIDNLKQLPAQLVELGRQIVLGLAQGILDGLAAIDDALGGIGQKVIGGLKAIFQISSPSLVMENIGQNVSQGLVQGINNGFNQSGGLQPLANNISQGMQSIATQSANQMNQLANSIGNGMNQIQQLTRGGGTFKGQAFGGMTGTNMLATQMQKSKQVILNNLANSMAQAGQAVGKQFDFTSGIASRFGIAEDNPLVKAAIDKIKSGGGGVKSASGGLTTSSGGGLSPAFSATGGGNITITIESITLPEGTLQEQATKLMQIIAKRIQKKKGLSGRSITQ